MRKNYVGIVVGVREVVSEQYLVDGIYKVDTKCQSCGSIRHVAATNFIAGHGSCLDCRTGARYNKADLTGNIYGDFVVTGKTDYSAGTGRVPMRCVECGHEKSITTSGVREGMICRKCHPVVREQRNTKQADPKQHMGKIVGFQKVVSEIIFQENGHHRVELECTECGHRKTMAIHDLFRKNRKTGGCTKCKAGMAKPRNRIGEEVGALVVTGEKSNGHYKSKVVYTTCKFCNHESEMNYIAFIRGAGKCKKCGSKDEQFGYSKMQGFSRAFRRVNPDEICSCCGISTWNGFKLPMQVDHIIPVSQGGRSVLSNGQYLCPNCHIIKTATEHPIWELQKAD